MCSDQWSSRCGSKGRALLIPGYEPPELSFLGIFYIFSASLHSVHNFFHILLFFMIQIQKLSSLASLSISFLNKCQLKAEVLAGNSLDKILDPDLSSLTLGQHKYQWGNEFIKQLFLNNSHTFRNKLVFQMTPILYLLQGKVSLLPTF